MAYSTAQPIGIIVIESWRVMYQALMLSDPRIGSTILFIPGILDLGKGFMVMDRIVDPVTRRNEVQRESNRMRVQA